MSEMHAERTDRSLPKTTSEVKTRICPNSELARAACIFAGCSNHKHKIPYGTKLSINNSDYLNPLVGYREIGTK